MSAKSSAKEEILIGRFQIEWKRGWYWRSRLQVELSKGERMSVERRLLPLSH